MFHMNDMVLLYSTLNGYDDRYCSEQVRVRLVSRNNNDACNINGPLNSNILKNNVLSSCIIQCLIDSELFDEIINSL